MSDTTFTGRNEIWAFALNHIGQRPFTGFGFQAFWGTSELVVSGSIREVLGLPRQRRPQRLPQRRGDDRRGRARARAGLDRRAAARGHHPQQRKPQRSTDLAVRAGLAVRLVLSAFESTFFGGGNCLWAMMIVSIVGLRYLVTMPLRGGSACLVPRRACSRSTITSIRAAAPRCCSSSRTACSRTSAGRWCRSRCGTPRTCRRRGRSISPTRSSSARATASSASWCARRA